MNQDLEHASNYLDATLIDLKETINYIWKVAESKDTDEYGARRMVGEMQALKLISEGERYLRSVQSILAQLKEQERSKDKNEREVQ